MWLYLCQPFGSQKTFSQYFLPLWKSIYYYYYYFNFTIAHLWHNLLLLHFSCRVSRWWWLKEAETCRRTTTCLYITVSNYSVIVGIYAVAFLSSPHCLKFWWATRQLRYCRTEQVYEAVALVACLACDGSTISQDTHYHEGIVGFLSFLSINAGVVPPLQHQQFHSKSFLIQYSSSCVRPTIPHYRASLNKPQITDELGV